MLFSGELDVRLSGNSVSGHNSDCRLRDTDMSRTRSADMHLWMAVHSQRQRKHATLLWNVAFRRSAESRLVQPRLVSMRVERTTFSPEMTSWVDVVDRADRSRSQPSVLIRTSALTRLRVNNPMTDGKSRNQSVYRFAK